MKQTEKKYLKVFYKSTQSLVFLAFGNETEIKRINELNFHIRRIVGI